MEVQLKRSSQEGHISGDMTRVIEAAVLAPTPDNNQPWMFRLGDNTIELYYDARRGLPSDVDHMFDLAGLGAAIENAVIAAHHLHYRTRVWYAESLPSGVDLTGRHLVARIEMEKNPNGKDEPFFPLLEDRCTNRKPYSTGPLPASQLDQLSAAAESFKGVAIHWLTERPDIDRMAKLVGAADRIRFEHQPFHAELFKQLRFRSEEAGATRDGLDVRTLELPLGAATVLHQLRRWPLMKLLNRAGFSRLMAGPSIHLVRRSAAVGALTVGHASCASFLEGGRALQRLWLEATALDLSFHPLGSIPIFVAHGERGYTGGLLPKHLARAEEIASQMREILPHVGDAVLHMCFRIGHSAAPSNTSLRRSPSALVIEG